MKLSVSPVDLLSSFPVGKFPLQKVESAAICVLTLMLDLLGFFLTHYFELCKLNM
ncbi:hypothetical protein ACQCT6_09145 [Cytobacillus gottheilii]